MQLKHLKPSHRERKRYLLLEGGDINKKAIEDAILEYLGILGYSNSCPAVIRKNENRMIISINREFLEKIRASFLISGKDIRIKKVSGSLKKLK